MSSFLSHPCHGKCTFEPNEGANAITYELDPESRLKPSERAAKRRRIERYAEIYINGGNLYLQCGVLKGPFDKWKNPWQEHGNLNGKSSSTDDYDAEKVTKTSRKGTLIRKPRKATAKNASSAPRLFQTSDLKISNKLKESSNTKTKPNSASSETRTRTRTKKAKKVPSKALLATHKEVYDVSVEKENTVDLFGEDLLGKVRRTKNNQTTTKRQSGKSEDDVGHFGEDIPQREVPDLVIPIRGTPTLITTRSTEHGQPGTSRSDGNKVQQDTIARTDGSVDKRKVSIQIEDAEEVQQLDYGVEKMTNEEISMEAAQKNVESTEQKSVQDHDMFSRRGGAVVSISQDQIRSEPLRSEGYLKSRAASKGSMSSPRTKPFLPPSEPKTKVNPLPNEIEGGHVLARHNHPRYMTFASPGLSPALSRHHQRHLTAIEQPQQDLCDEEEATDHQKISSFNSQQGNKLSSPSCVQRRIKSKGTDQQTSESCSEPKAPSCYKISSQLAIKDSSSRHNPKAKILPQKNAALGNPRDVLLSNQMSMDFSTQGALIAAQDAFQDQLLRKEELMTPALQKEKTHSPQRLNDNNILVTPFANLKAEFEGAYVPSQTGPHISTQELFDMVSPLTFSNVTKASPRKRANLASSPSEQLKKGEEAIVTSQLGRSPASTSTCEPVQGDQGNSKVKSCLKPSGLPVTFSMKNNISQPAFSISPKGTLQEISEYGQEHNPDVVVEAALDDANSFLQSWDLESELKNLSSSITARGEMGKRIALVHTRETMS